MVDETKNEQNAQKERPRQHESRHRPQNRGPGSNPARKAQGTKETELDDDETEQDRTSSHSHPRRGGRPEKKVIEEWANDPYCE